MIFFNLFVLAFCKCHISPVENFHTKTFCWIIMQYCTQSVEKCICKYINIIRKRNFFANSSFLTLFWCLWRIQNFKSSIFWSKIDDVNFWSCELQIYICFYFPAENILDRYVKKWVQTQLSRAGDSWGISLPAHSWPT